MKVLETTGRSFVVVGLVALLAGLAVPATASEGTSASRGRIVVLEDSVAAVGEVAREHLRQHDLTVTFVYEHALKGYAAEMTDAAAAAVALDPRVSFVEDDRQMGIFAQTVPTGISRIFATANGNLDIDGTDDLRVDADVAVIDTGVDFDHPDLDVVHRADCTSLLGCQSNSGDDLNGHGTHVAGSSAAIDNGIGVVGVAPGARLWAVKVLGDAGTGLTSWVIAGVDYVTARADRIEVANMSLGGGSSSSLCEAVEGSIGAGVVYAVAAGNEDDDARDSSPANCSGVITTSALADFDGEPGGLGSPTCRNDEDDTLANFSNWGSTIEIAAPGVCILSTWAGGGYNTISGTSMASPHAAGAAAILASGGNDPQDGSDVASIVDTIIAEGNFDWTDDSGDGTKEPLLDVGDTTVFAPNQSGSDPEPPPADDPWALEVTGSKTRGVKTAQLSWDPSATSASQVDVWRDGAIVETTGNDGSHTDTIGKGGGSHTYQLCEAGGTSNCSAKVTVTF